ncbi:YbhB/YbcL family Raf kinase inhibitor-like protein [Micromonospora sp. WMMD1155]|uniref:YbhB/YbcL family Raf kinase inhibitor-like protein n=1 Tax=Micromonospora sp. WMMD1155 TaxID=3016094 RepID=UPI00249C3059|nr:YbhB/YbcL family Raf kinase inhibitor-like protein [Micromonospora sp. WMMD1155]WFE54947.1 YbhB/YbcL family Raf kinase inhibitor-like protein [Micromonospora sp. WMMD1155]
MGSSETSNAGPVTPGRLIGRLLRGVRAGERRSVARHPALQSSETVVLDSPAFAPGSPIPTRHAGEGVGDNLSPALAWSHVPAGTRQLLLIFEDLDVPLRKPLLHTVALLDAALPGLSEGQLNKPGEGVRFLPAAFGRTGYAGPRPIPGHGTHTYRFLLYALDRPIADDLPTASVEALLAQASGHVLAAGQLAGTYRRD